MRDRTLDDVLGVLKEESQKSSALSVQEILKVLGGKSRLVVLIFLSLPFCLPLQIPGLSTLFGAMIALVACRFAFGKRVWLPKRILLKKISSRVIRKISQKSLKMVNKLNRFLHPRLSGLCEHKGMQFVNGFLMTLLGVLLALPIPVPFTNFAAGWSLLFINLGLLEVDGVFVLIGYLMSFMTFAYFIFIFFKLEVLFKNSI